MLLQHLIHSSSDNVAYICNRVSIFMIHELFTSRLCGDSGFVTVVKKLKLRGLKVVGGESGDS